MAKKKSIKKAAIEFRKSAEEILNYVIDVKNSSLSEGYVSWSYEFGIIKLYKEFEDLMSEAIVGAINHDTSTLSKATGFDFPKQLNEEVCKYLVVGQGYFDFKGRDGLIKLLKKFVPDNHYLLVTKQIEANIKQL